MTAEQYSRSEFRRIRGLRYHLRRWGDPWLPELVLLHGFLDVSETFHFLVQPLLAQWQVLAPDWRGFGYTEWQPGGYWFPEYLGDLDALLDASVPDRPVVLVGHSMGAQVAALYAGARPQRVSRLVCLDGPFLPDTPAERLQPRYAGWLDRLRREDSPRSYESFDQLATAVQRRHPDLPPGRALFVARCWGQEDGFGRITLRADPVHRIYGPTPLRFADTAALFHHIAAPTLFVDAARSRVRSQLPEADIAWRRGLVRDQRSIRIEHAGHMLHFDQPEATAAAILEFLTPV
jgi:pimeloyl-ACP methyl ester carboxylesterase